MYLLPIYFTLISFILSFFLGRSSNNYYIGFQCSIFIFFGFITSLFIFYEVVLYKSPVSINFNNRISINLLNVKWSFMFDSLTSTMLVVILSISTCAHFYSIEYMLFDPHQIKFMSYLSLFTFFMVLLVTANNYIILFLGWEGVGICSYLLINFWHTRLGANKSAIMAVFVNKIGDISLLVAYALIFLIFYNFDFSIIISSMYITMYEDVADLDLYYVNILYVIAFFFIIAAVGKSAQLGLHMWLPEAMEGPTPVSSLIHAATMVTAGIFLIIRSNLLFQWCSDILILIILIGSLTAFVGSTIGIFQFDMKKIIAYSTCSQLGYMFLACGLNGYMFSIYHLVNHAFFKALLFLIAGYIIHAVNNEQDIRKLGGLLKILPFAYIGINIGSLSLLGFPFFSGFFSKEKIIELFYSFFYVNIDNVAYINLLYFLSMLATISVTFTVLYSVKLMVNVFFYLFANNYSNLILIHYSSYITLFPLFLLSILSIISGYFLEDLMVGFTTSSWNMSIFLNFNGDSFNTNIFEFNLWSSKLPLMSIFYFLFLFFIIYYAKEVVLFNMKMNNLLIEYIYQFLNKKYIFINKNIIYFSIRKTFRLSYSSMYFLFDKGIIEILGPFGLNNFLNSVINKSSNINSGLVYNYIGQIGMGIILFLLIFFYI